MLVQWFANLGNDAVPNWLEITDSMQIHFTGAGSTPSLATPVIRPAAGYVWNEEVWIGPAVMAGGQQAANWRKPNSVNQQGKVFKIVFSEAVCAAPFLSAYDDEAFDTWQIEMLAGTDETSWTGMIKAIMTGSESVNTPPAQGWCVKETGHAGSGNPNALQGNSQFVTIPFIPAAGGDFTFTIAAALPSDASYGKEGKFDPKIAVTFVHV